MHRDIFTPEQADLLPLVKLFSKNFYLVGGTAIALYLGHRESLDFDMFSGSEFNNAEVRQKVSRHTSIEVVYVNKKSELTMIAGGVKWTFFHYPFSVNAEQWFEDIARMPTLLDLSAMKAYALGQRAKWKDYVDLYFVIREHHGLSDISKRARELFGGEFNEKLLRVQLSYFEDIDYSEEVIYLSGQEVSDSIIKEALERWSMED